MVKKQKKIVCFAKIWKPLRQHFGFFEDWRNFGNSQKFGRILKMGVALILRYLLTDLLLIKIKLAKIGSSATRALVLNRLAFLMYVLHIVKLQQRNDKNSIKSADLLLTTLFANKDINEYVFWDF